MYETIAFYFFAIITLGMFSVTVMSNNILYSLSSLAGGMVFLSGFFFLLDAEFLGAVQIVVYTGAVIVLYAFGMMFFDSSKSVKENIIYKKVIYSLSILLTLLLLFIVLAPIYSQKVQAAHPIDADVQNTQALGVILFTKYLVPFELAAIMLLVAMIAGIILAGKKMDKNKTLDDDGFLIKESL